MALSMMNNYQSVFESLPRNDGKFYDVICIVKNENISCSYGYRLGHYCDGVFHLDGGMFFKDKDYKNDWKQQRVIAWQPLPLATLDEFQALNDKANLALAKGLRKFVKNYMEGRNGEKKLKKSL